MAISRMNAVFAKHHRWIFGVFTVIIIVTFVGFLSPGEASFLEGFTSSSSVGTVFGHGIGRTQLIEQMRFNSLLGERVQNDEQAMQNAFGNLALLQIARDRGLAVSDAEVAQALRAMPYFVNPETGKFDKEVYRKSLAAMQIKPADFEEALRRQMLVGKLRAAVFESIAVTPDEVEQFYNFNNEVFDVKVKRFNSPDFLAGIVPGEAEVKEYFESARDKFMIPAQLSGEAVVFSLNDPALAAEAAKGVTDADVKKFYDTNKGMFAKLGADNQVSVPEFDAAKSEALKLLIQSRARDLAHAKAGNFIRLASNSVQSATDKKAAFDRVAAEQGLKLISTGVFTPDAVSAGDIKDAALLKALANVSDSVPMTTVVNGRDAVYVGLRESRVPERQAEYSEVAREVLSAYRQMRAVEAARTQAQKTYAELAALAPEALTGAVKADGFVDLPASTRRELDSAFKPEMMAIGRLATNLRAGELAPPEDTIDGAVIVYVVKRTPADSAKFAEAKASTESELLQMKKQLNGLNFMTYLNANCVYKLGNERQ